MNTFGQSDMFPVTIWQFGPVGITDTTVTTWGLVLLLWLVSWLIGRTLRSTPGPVQVAAEAVVAAIENAVRDVVPDHHERVLPFVMTLWIFLALANLIGLIPGLHSPTRDLSATTALALLVFLSTHWFGFRAEGPRSYLRHYLAPSPIMLPFHIISEITRTVALAIRLFGNMLSMEMIALLLLLVAGFLVPVPILMLHIIEALVQAYIFGMLALIYIAGGMQAQKRKQSGDRSEE